MIYKLEKLKKLNNAYVQDDFVQVMVEHQIPYLSVVGDDIIYHASEGAEATINKYVQDTRRFDFPYFNIPAHKEKKGKILFNYVNQIYDYDKPYIILRDEQVDEEYVTKTWNGREALIVSRRLGPIFKSNEDYLYCGELREKVKELYRNLEGKKYIFKNGGHLISEDELLYDVEENSYLIINDNDREKQITGLKIEEYDSFYSLNVVDFPFYSYNGDDLRCIEGYAQPVPEPKVKRFYNRSIPKADIIKARTMANMKRR